ncbi:CDC27 family protein [bacterium]|nr:CDC27 family protein [bacterium]
MTKKQREIRAFLQLKRIEERNLKFEYLRVDMSALEELDQAIDLWEEGNVPAAMKRYQSLIKRFPEFIDAHHHLALLYDASGNRFVAKNIWSDIVHETMSLFPEDFYFGGDRLQWIFLENRPFLTAYHALGLCYLDNGETDKAFIHFMNMLDLNPNDNQGIRELAVDCCFRLKRPKDALRICNRYKGDVTEGIVYGRPLALFQSGKPPLAATAMSFAIRTYPLIARELVKAKSVKPRDLRETEITLGGADQAYFYRQRNYAHWKNTPGALDQLQSCLNQHDDQS